MLYIDLVGVPGMVCYIEIRWECLVWRAIYRSGGGARYGCL